MRERVCVRVGMSVCMCVRAYMIARVCPCGSVGGWVYMSQCVHVCACACKRVGVNERVRACACMCVQVCARVCMCVYVGA